MIQEPLFSEHWHRVKDLNPRLASDVCTQLHVYRNIPYHIVHRRSTSVYHRLDAQTYKMVAELDGTVTIDQLWQKSLESSSEHAPTQSEFMSLLARLHESELITVNRKLDAEQLFSRARQADQLDRKQRYLNPLFMRFSLFDPNRLLDKLRPLAIRLFSRTALVSMIVLIVVALFTLLPRLTELRYELASSNLLSAGNLMVFLILFPALKFLHEAAHGLAIKRCGGEVHEMGIALMVLIPIPYVDASAASALPNKWDRMLISAAGVFVELSVAALATIIWSITSGTVHEAALALMLIGGVSTVLFNGNPLLKFDGYYVLSDALEIPNLADRSRHYLLSIARRYLYGTQTQKIQLSDRMEGVWLLSYGLLSTIYKFIIMSAIALMISKKFFFLGMIMAIWIAVSMLARPLYGWLRFAFFTPQTSRFRSVFSTLSITAVLIIFTAFMPMPLSTVSRGVVWLPENALIHIQTSCEVTQLITDPGTMVEPGDALFYCKDHYLETEKRVLQGKLDELNAVRMGLDLSDRVGHEKLGLEMETISTNLQHLEENIDRQRVTAKSKGQFHTPDPISLEGKFLKPGSQVAYVVPENIRTVRVAIEQSGVRWFEADEIAELQFDEQSGKRKIYTSTIQRQTPKSTYTVPSAGLTTLGGGRFVADPASDGRTLMEPIFDIELAWPENAPTLNVGSHVSVVFRHAPTTLLSRLLASAQQSLLGRVDA